MKLLKTLSIFTLVTVFFFSCGETKKDNSEAMETTTEEVTETVEVEQTEPNIVEVAVGNENFSTLVTAVKAADLVGTLSSEGPFTVFAPTNDAFAKLPEGTIASLLEPDSKNQLTSILTYHVVSGKFEAAAVIEAIQNNNGAYEVTTVQGGTITLSLNDGKVMLKDANGGMSTVVIADEAASNGVIHALDTVIMPE
ncbi:fasciclin domain-containing protein [Winogradskyella sp.]|uniref:fasciclin domain-containing protein n=1 Tax=Winogradskyella sp. TaxID=1883156 RepID=UPI003F6D9F0A